MSACTVFPVTLLNSESTIRTGARRGAFGRDFLDVTTHYSEFRLNRTSAVHDSEAHLTSQTRTFFVRNENADY